MLTRVEARGLTKTGHWFKFWMPYRFEKIEVKSRKHAYLPVNRNYKPLGYLGHKRVDYQDYAAQAVVFSSDPHQFPGIWTDSEGLFLYNDDPDSRADYFARFERLMCRSHTLVGTSPKLLAALKRDTLVSARAGLLRPTA